MIENEQDFIFSPRPKKPPILIGGNSTKALQRVLKRGDGWMPMIKDDGALVSACAKLTENMVSSRKIIPTIIPLRQLNLVDLDESIDTILKLKEAGCTGVEHFQAYATLDEFKYIADRLQEIKNKV